ncbi:MAG: GDSL-type esterase/lipase family protein [Candidatus Spyradenecus sp.]
MHWRTGRIGLALLAAAVLAVGAPVGAAEGAVGPLGPGREATWGGFRQTHFTFAGRSAWVIEPKVAAPGRPWIWRARFPGYHNEIERALLERGYHTVYIDTPNLYGSPTAMAVWDGFYRAVTEQFALNPKGVLYGCSRGGLFIYNFAHRWPERVAAIYGDTPVMDFTSWPEGRDGRGTRSEGDWQELKRVYGFADDAAAEAYRDIPMNYAEQLAQARVPIWHTLGAEDRIVPPKYNSLPFVERFQRAGGEIALHWNKGPYALDGHHFPLDAVRETVDFIEWNTPLPALSAVVEATWQQDAEALAPALRRLAGLKEARVVFLGGSITQNPGWQNRVAESLRRRYPGVNFRFDNLGIASLGSVSHVFRWREHINGPVDLLFFEAAVNDQNLPLDDVARAYEGTVRGLRQAYPEAGLVCLHFAEPRHTADYAAGQTPKVIACHQQIAAHYRVAQINLAKEVSDRLAAGQFDWARDFRNLHPSPFGQRLYYRAVCRLLNTADRLARSGQPLAPATLPELLRADAWANGCFLPAAAATEVLGGEKLACWKPEEPKETRLRFFNCPVLKLVGEGAACSFTFEGPLVGLYVIAGPRSAPVAWSIDGGPWQVCKTLTPWSHYIYMPWPYILQDHLPPGPHTLRLELRPEGSHDTLWLYGLTLSPTPPASRP